MALKLLISKKVRAQSDEKRLHKYTLSFTSNPANVTRYSIKLNFVVYWSSNFSLGTSYKLFPSSLESYSCGVILMHFNKDISSTYRSIECNCSPNLRRVKNTNGALTKIFLAWRVYFEIKLLFFTLFTVVWFQNTTTYLLFWNTCVS